MAGDWIPTTVDLPTRREVLAIASITQRSRHEVVGRLVEFWIWAQGETETGRLVDVHVDALETALGPDTCFWQAVIKVGWLVDDPDGLVIPNFDRWLGKGAKARFLKNMRQMRWRNGHPDVDAPVDAPVDADSVSKSSPRDRETEQISSPVSVKDTDTGAPVVVPIGRNGKNTTLPFTPNDLAEGYNECVAKPFGLPTVTTPLSAGRIEKARSRIREHPSQAWWNAVFDRYAQSRFLRGECGQQGWRGGTFDFLVKNPENAIKAHEGAYTDQPAKAARR